MWKKMLRWNLFWGFAITIQDCTYLRLLFWGNLFSENADIVESFKHPPPRRVLPCFRLDQFLILIPSSFLLVFATWSQNSQPTQRPQRGLRGVKHVHGEKDRSGFPDSINLIPKSVPKVTRNVRSVNVRHTRKCMFSLFQKVAARLTTKSPRDSKIS